MKTAIAFLIGGAVIRLLIFVPVLVCLCSPRWAGAGVFVLETLGDQDFVDGSFLNDAASFNGPTSGDPSPFDSFKGTDYGADFSETWTFSFQPGLYTSVTVQFGLFDADGGAVGDQVSFFGFDGNDLTAIAIGETNAPSVGLQLEYNVYTLTIPQEALDDLSDGSASFTLTLKRGLSGPAGSSSPSIGGTSGDPAGSPSPAGVTLFNGAGLDFATLQGELVPEPSTLALATFGLIGLLAFGSRRRRRA